MTDCSDIDALRRDSMSVFGFCIHYRAGVFGKADDKEA